MSSVTSYHFNLINLENLQGLEYMSQETRDHIAQDIGVEGDVVPPTVRLAGQPIRLLNGSDGYAQLGDSDQYALFQRGGETYCSMVD